MSPHYQRPSWVPLDDTELDVPALTGSESALEPRVWVTAI